MYTSILVPTDGSELANKAVKEAARLAKTTGAKLVLFHAIRPYPATLYTEGITMPNPPKTAQQAKQELEAEAQKVLAKALAEAGSSDVVIEQQFAIDERPYAAIIEAAKKNNSDLIAMASHGYGGLGALFLGSETQKVLANTKIPVLVVR